MVNVTINNIPVSVKKGTTIMEAARSAGIHVPHLCFLKEINEIGACRLCCVEVEGEDTSNEWLEPVSDEEYNKLK